ncbi:MAG: S8 family peptidase [Clostridium sp.]|uniref:S8 family peptidase n=1 Tax=Clostridium sp. TaxID=1506 RepID=UPI003069A365
MNRSNKVPERIFSDINYDHYIVQYQGDIEQYNANQPDYYVTVINDNYAILSLNKNIYPDNENLNLSSIVYVKPVEMYTLQQISPIEASQVIFLQLDLPLNLTGNGVNVAIVDTGIDYLSDEFMTSSGETRIEYIWDQTIPSLSTDTNASVPYGTIYKKEQIQTAIQAYRNGQSPYEIVPSKDEIGHGTNMAGIIGGTGKNPDLRGVVPDCNFVVVKLLEDISFKSQFGINVPLYNITSLFTALESLYKYSLTNYKPMVIYFPLGTNFGNHKGNGLLEQYIETICKNNGIVIVNGTGNERNNGTHTSGVISKVGESGTIEIDVSETQKNLWVEIWTTAPNLMSLDIISPSGENSGVINILINTTESYTFIFEKTKVKVNYFLPEEISGDELIRIRFYDIQPGIWKLRLTASSVLDGKFNAWLPQDGITVGGTRFSLSDPYGTITNPSNSNYLVTIAAYNQNNNNILNFSGMAFANNFVGVIDVAAGGINALTVAPNNKTSTVTGTSVSAAVAAGACAMLFQWGIVDDNDPYMYSQTIKTYLARGTTKRPGDIYPNPQWGYGMLDVLAMFKNMI